MVVTTSHPLNNVKGLIVPRHIQRFEPRPRQALGQVPPLGLTIGDKSGFTEEIEVVQNTEAMSGIVDTEITQDAAAADAIGKRPFVWGFFFGAPTGLN